MIFRPDIKPPMWGPPDAVQYAVRVNAERMGVDPAKIASYLPLFEGAGFSALDLASGVVIPASSTNFGWNSGNLVLPSPPARLSTTKHVVPVIGTGDYTVVVVARPASLTQINALFAINKYDFAAAINTSGWLYIYDSGNKSSSNTMVPITKMSSMVFSRSSGAGKYYLDGVADGSYSHRDSIPNPTTVTWLADRPAAGYVFAGDVAFCLLSVEAFTSDQIAQLHATPYALLMPVSRPVYFDLGAGTSNTQVTTTPGALGLSGSAPSSAFSGAVTSAPGVGALTITPQAAEILFSGAITSAPEPGPLDLTGHPSQSAFSGAITFATAPGSLAFSGLAGQIIVSGAATVTVLTAAGALSLTGAAPSSAYSGTVRAQTLPGLLALAGVAPGLLHSGAVTVELLAGELSIDGQAVETTIGGGIRVETAAGLLSLLGNAPSVVISGGVRVETQPGAMALTGAAPVMIHAGLIEIVTAAGGLSIAGLPVTVSAGERLGPIFAPGLHSITVQRAVLSVTPIRGLRRFDGH